MEVVFFSVRFLPVAYLIACYALLFMTAGKIQATSEYQYDLIEEKIPFEGIVFANMEAGEYHPTKLKNWNKYAYDPVLEAEGKALKNVYATEIKALADGAWLLYYGGWNSDDPTFKADQIYSGVSRNFLFRNKKDFTPPQWHDRKLVFKSTNGIVVNDPTLVRTTEGQYIMHFSRSAPPVNGVKVSDTVSYSVSHTLQDWLFSDGDRNNPVTVYGKDGKPITFLHRPSLVYDNDIFYLYYDQGGYPNATKNNGFSIHVATGKAGQFFSYEGEVLKPGSPENGYAGTPEVEKFPNGWIMFYDRHLNALAYATSKNGLEFEDHGKLIENLDTTITNVNILRKDNSLLGVLYGAFPKITHTANCDYPIANYCISQGAVHAYFLQKRLYSSRMEVYVGQKILLLTKIACS